MKQFDLYEYIYEYDGDVKMQTEPEGEETQNQDVEERPTVQKTETPFDQFTGASIKNIEFSPHENGGSIKIYTDLSPIPLVISWSGTRVTSKYKDIVALT